MLVLAHIGHKSLELHHLFLGNVTAALNNTLRELPEQECFDCTHIHIQSDKYLIEIKVYYTNS